MPWSTWRSLTSTLIESGIAPARHLMLSAVDQVLENPAGRDAGGLAAHLERHLGLDDLLGADPGEVEVEDLLAEVVPLHVADQHGLGRAAQVELGQVAGRLDHPPDVVAAQRDRHDRLLVPVDDARESALALRSRRATRVPVPLFFCGSRGSTRIFTASAIDPLALAGLAFRRGP